MIITEMQDKFVEDCVSTFLLFSYICIFSIFLLLSPPNFLSVYYVHNFCGKRGGGTLRIFYTNILKLS